MSCPSKSATDLDCNREDQYSSHMMLLHRNEEAGMEWQITTQDKIRWGVAPVKKVTQVKTNLGGDNSEGDGSQGHLGESR